LSKLSKNNLIF